ncbi:MAG TPA: topoisomerase C-terminal repeat-containing protein, partial [Saprospiraceae bacterium]|nr:topoisomerase C-terminal repeat-containing protein [Saprospiraceae bacterium]
DIGMVVSDFLSEHFGKIMEYGFTANVENQLDKIATDGLDWKGMLKDFYKPFHAKVSDTMENAERAKGKRIIGKDNNTGLSVIAQMTRFGPVIQLGDKEEIGENDKPRFANLKPGQSIETINLEDALDLFKLPRTIGSYKGDDVVVNTGRFGPYIKINEMYINLPKTTDPMQMSLEDAVPMIQAKLEEMAPICLYNNLPVTKGKGRFGPFIKWNEMFINIPAKYNIDTLTQDEAVELIKLKLDKEANRYIQQWPEASVANENGRSSPFVRLGKNNIKIPKVDGVKPEEAYLKNVSLNTVKSWIKNELPNAFEESKTTKKAKSVKKK